MSSAGSLLKIETWGAQFHGYDYEINKSRYYFSAEAPKGKSTITGGRNCQFTVVKVYRFHDESRVFSFVRIVKPPQGPMPLADPSLSHEHLRREGEASQRERLVEDGVSDD